MKVHSLVCPWPLCTVWNTNALLYTCHQDTEASQEGEEGYSGQQTKIVFCICWFRLFLLTYKKQWWRGNVIESGSISHDWFYKSYPHALEKYYKEGRIAVAISIIVSGVTL